MQNASSTKRFLYSVALTFTLEVDEESFSSVAQLCLTLCVPMDGNTPGIPVHHRLPEFIQTHVHRVGDAIQPSHPLSSTSPPTCNLSQHQCLFQWVNSSHQVAWSLSFNISLSNEYLGLISFDGLVGSPGCLTDSQESSSTPQFKSINFSVLSFLHGPALT